MRENYRKSIASIEKLPQFTTMNVIDGQAGIIICSSLIFYSLTINNILNIIVLLILAGVSIATLTGQNGILTQTNNAKEEARASSVEEQRNLWKSESGIDKYTGGQTAQRLEELLDDLINENLITEAERQTIEEKGYIVIGCKNISFAEGLVPRSYTITTSSEEIKFEKLITQGDIIVEKPEYTTYEIIGISNSKDGEYVNSGSIEGKSGNLEIIGDIQDATLKYNLTNFMQGDETFYCKVDIDGEEYYKEIKIIQGDAVTYEEDFIKIAYVGNWTIDYNDNYTEDKAMMADTTDSGANFEFSYYGSKFQVASRQNENTGYTRLIVSENGSTICTVFRNFYADVGIDNFITDIFDNSTINNLTTSYYTVNVSIAKKLGGYGNLFYVDQIIIYK